MARGALGDFLAPVEVLNELVVCEVGVLLAGLELEDEAQGAGLAVALGVELESLNGHVFQGIAQDGGIVGQNVLVDLGGSAGEHAHPELGLHLGHLDDFGALVEQRLGELDSVAH